MVELQQNGSVYGTQKQSVCITSQLAEPERNRFLVGTSGFGEDNQLHLIDFDEDDLEITSHIYQHPNEIKSIAPCPTKVDLLFTCYTKINGNNVSNQASLWLLSAAEIDDHGKLRTGMDTNTFMSELLTLGNDNVQIKNVLWDVKNKRTDKVFTYNDNALHLWDLDRGLSKGTLAAKVALSEIIPAELYSNDSVPPFITAGNWNPHSPDNVAISHNDTVTGIDLRSMKPTFHIPRAHSLVVRDFDFNPNKEHHLVTGGDDCQIRFWDVRMVGSKNDEASPMSPNNSQTILKKGCLKQISDHTHWVQQVSFNKYHDQLLLSSSSDGQVNLQSVVSISSGAKFAGEVTESETEPDDNGHDRSPRREKPTDGLVASYSTHEDSVYSICWSNADPWTFASVSFDGRVVVNVVPAEHKYKIML